VTEARNAQDEGFGEHRLMAYLGEDGACAPVCF
jgi:hypothetical protein